MHRLGRVAAYRQVEEVARRDGRRERVEEHGRVLRAGRGRAHVESAEGERVVHAAAAVDRAAVEGVVSVPDHVQRRGREEGQDPEHPGQRGLAVPALWRRECEPAEVKRTAFWARAQGGGGGAVGAVGGEGVRERAEGEVLEVWDELDDAAYRDVVDGGAEEGLAFSVDTVAEGAVEVERDDMARGARVCFEKPEEVV